MVKGTDNREVAYFNGEFLSAKDYSAEQSYHVQSLRRAAAATQGWGILGGLGVAAGSGGNTVVSPGTAMDGRGRLIRLVDEREIGPPPPAITGAALLTAAYGTRASAEIGPKGVRYLEEHPLVAWVAASEAPQNRHPVEQIVLARHDPGNAAALSFDDRHYAGAPIGTLTLQPQSPSPPLEISAWSSGPARGLEFRAARTIFAQSGGAQKALALAVRNGAMGIGTLSPKATLDIAPPTSDQPGKGTLSSRGNVVSLSDPEAAAVLGPGFTLSVMDQAGHTQRTTISSKLPGGALVVDRSLDCTDVPYQYRRPLAVRLTDAKGNPALAIDLAGQVGFGTEAPESRAEVSGGDLVVAGAARTVAFADAGQVATSAPGATARIEFAPLSARLSVTASERIDWATSGGESTLTLAGNWGIGTDTPETRLDVTGFIDSTKGFVFPDGSIQKSAEISVPIGAIIDWWRGDSSIQIPENYRICNGEVIEGDSPLKGQRTPKLLQTFTVGTKTEDDIGKPAGQPKHLHSFRMPQHTHQFPHSHPNLENRTTQEATDSNGMAGAANPNARKHHTHPFSAVVGQQSTTTTGPYPTQQETENTADASPLPSYMGLIKLIRVS